MSEDPLKHVLVPKHEKISEKEKKELFEKYHIDVKQLPRINVKDAAIIHMNCEPGDVIKITRNSATSGKTLYFRGVSSE